MQLALTMAGPRIGAFAAITNCVSLDIFLFYLKNPRNELEPWCFGTLFDTIMAFALEASRSLIASF
jgi:hypothetical protein